MAAAAHAISLAMMAIRSMLVLPALLLLLLVSAQAGKFSAFTSCESCTVSRNPPPAGSWLRARCWLPTLFIDASAANLCLAIML